MNRITTCAAMLVAFGSLHCVGFEAPRCDGPVGVFDEPCAAAALEVPIGPVGSVAFDALGQLHFSNATAVFKVDSDGMLERVAGTGRRGFGGDGGPATQALLGLSMPPDIPWWWDFGVADIGGIAFHAGELYIADTWNHRVRVVDQHGTIRTLVGGEMRRADDVGLPIFSGFWFPQGIGVDASGGVYVTGQFASLLRIPAEDGPIEQVTDYPFMNIAMNIALDAAGDVYVGTDCAVYKVRRNGQITVMAGRARNASCDWSGRADTLNIVFAVALDDTGGIYMADPGMNCVRKAQDGKITTIAGTCRPQYKGGGGYAGDGGPAAHALLSGPTGVALDAAGNLFIADHGNNRVRRVDREGIITTIAGNGEAP